MQDGRVLHFLVSEGDSVVVRQIDTQPTGAPIPNDHRELERRYDISVKHASEHKSTH